MSLIVKLRINDEATLATLVIRRMQGTTDPASWGIYDYSVVQHVAGTVHVVARGDVRHRYGDGALTLLRKVCDKADL